MRPTLIKSTLKSLFPLQRATSIIGAPGGGKTSIVREVADELGVAYVERHLPTMLVEDFGVLYPKRDTDDLGYRLPDWFPVKGKAPEEGILCFDDRNQAGNDLQKVLANIQQARNLHGHYLPDGWMVVSTGNRQSDRAGSNRVLSHLADRESTSMTGPSGPLPTT
jgi:MoxR-like ATPase